MIEEQVVWNSGSEIVVLPHKGQVVSKDPQFFPLILLARVHTPSSPRGSVFQNSSFFQIEMRESGNGQFFLGSKTEKHIVSKL